MKKFLARISLFFLLGIPFHKAVFAQQFAWEEIASGTSDDLISMVQAGNFLVAVGDQGRFVFYQSSSGLIQSGQVAGVSRFISAEKIRVGSAGFRFPVLTDDNRIFSIDTMSLSLIPDSLPELPGNGRNASRIIDLNTSGIDQMRYGFPLDSGKILACKIPYTTSRLEFQLPFHGKVSDLIPFGAWGVLAAGDSGRIWRTSGLDQSFLPVVQLHHNQNINRLIRAGSGSYWAAGNQGKLLFSQDDGSSWNLVPVPSQENLLGGIQNGNELILFTSAGKILRGSNNGQNWSTEFTLGLAIRSMMKASDGSIYCAGNSGKILKRMELNSFSGKAQSFSKINLKINGQVLENHEAIGLDYRLTDAAGRVLKAGKIDSRQRLIFTRNAGFYFLELNAEDGRFFRSGLVLAD